MMGQGLNRQTDIELANLRRQHQLILNSVGEGVYGLDTQGNTTFVNPAAASLIGWKRSDLIGKSMHDILHHSNPDGSFYPREECHIYAAFKEGTVRRVDNEVFWRKDGTSFPVEYISTPMHNEKGELVGSVVTFRDITQRKLSESILQQANEELEQRVAERTSELSQANEKLRKLDQVRSRFVAMVCHEFRNPLNNISFSVSSLKRYNRQLSATQKTEYLSDVEANIERMTQMIDELLVIGEIETKGINTTRDRLDLVIFCQELATEFTQTYSNYQIQFDSNLLSLEAEIDYRLIRYILTNILTNAVRYSSSDRLIKFQLSSISNYALFTIKDRGIGIPKDDLDRIFEPFHRGRNTSNIPGTGLGLNIVKRFINLIDGEIKIASQVNRGTKVEIKVYLQSNL